MDAAWIAKTFDARAALYFGMLPRARFAIKPVPDDIAPFYTAGRGGRASISSTPTISNHAPSTI